MGVGVFFRETRAAIVVSYMLEGVIMRPSLLRAITGGIVATAAIDQLMKLFPRSTQPKPGRRQARLLQARRRSAMVQHALEGTVLFPLFYGGLLYPALTGSPRTRGAISGAALWLISEAALAPLFGRGLFPARQGGGVAESIAVHLAYGAMLGQITGAGDEQRIAAARERWLRAA
jgi:hypothetical protein